MPDGYTRMQHYEAAGVPPEEWGIPPMPPGMSYLWDWFVALASGRGSGGLAANPISWEAMQAFFAFMGERPTIADINAIKMLDRMSLSEHGEKKGRQHGK